MKNNQLKDGLSSKILSSIKTENPYNYSPLKAMARSKVTDVCVNGPIKIEGLTTEVTVHVPIVIADFTVHIYLSSSFDLNLGITMIRNIVNQITISKCQLIQDTNNVCIKGIIRKKIEYNTFIPSKVIGAIGHIKKCIYVMSFECTTPVKFKPIGPTPDTHSKTIPFTYLEDPQLSDVCLKKRVMHSRGGQIQSSITTEDYSKAPLYDIVSSRIAEHNEIVSNYEVPCLTMPLGIKNVMRLESSMRLLVRIKLLQDKDVVLPDIN